MWTRNLSVLLAILFIVQVVNSLPKWRSSGRSSHSYSRPRVSHTSHTSHTSHVSSVSAPKVTHTSHSYPSGGRFSGTSNTHATSVHSYPTGSGLSGSGSSRITNTNSHAYPSSGGLSGSNNHNYPAAVGGGLSGTGSGSAWINNLHKTNNHPPSYGGNPATSHVYPPSNGGLSGNTNSGSYSHNTGSNWNHGSQWNQGSHANPPPHYYAGSSNGQKVHTPNYYQPPPVYNPLPPQYPQYYGPPPVYVNTVRNSGSQYGDLLTGLALYNLGRSSSHQHDHHYYHNNYGSDYNNRYNNHDTYSSGSSNRHRETQQPKNYAQHPKNDTQCSLKIVTQNTTEKVKVPCDIVTSFFSDNQTLSNSTVTNSTSVANNSNASLNNSSATAQYPSVTSSTISPLNSNIPKLNNIPVNLGANAILVREPNITNLMFPSLNSPENNATIATNVSSTVSANTTKTLHNDEVIKDNFNLTTITTNNTNANSSSTQSVPVDPLKVIGPALDIKGMTCSVEIKTKISTRSTIVPCHLLLQYANSLNNPPTTTKPRLNTKEWIKSPPWWSMFAFSF